MSIVLLENLQSEDVHEREREGAKRFERIRFIAMKRGEI